MFALRECLSGRRTLTDIMAAATGVTADSRLVNQGNVFVALKGFQDDGNSYIGEAIAKGATAIVTEYPLDITPDIPIFVVANARRSLAELCALFFGHPGKLLRITAITGTNGKTTTAAMIDTVFNSVGLKTGLIGTDKIKVAGSIYCSPLTTPDAPTLQKRLFEMVQKNVTHVTMETSAQGIELERVTGIPFQCGVLTNLSPDHLDFYDSFRAYIEAKYRFLGILSHNAPLCVNADDTECMKIADKYVGPIVTYGIRTDAHITAKEIMLTNTGCSFKIQSELPTVSFLAKCNLRLYGLHNIYNALAAMSACLLHQISPDSILNGLSKFTGVERRMQIRRLNNFTLADDTALNPASIDAVFKAAEQIPFRRMAVITSIRGSRGTAINYENAAQIIKWHNYYHWERIIVTSSCSHTDCYNCVTAAEEIAFLTALSQADIPFVHFRELPDAISFALKQVRPDDLLLLLGAQGMDAGSSILENMLSRE